MNTKYLYHLFIFALATSACAIKESAYGTYGTVIADEPNVSLLALPGLAVDDTAQITANAVGGAADITDATLVGAGDVAGTAEDQAADVVQATGASVADIFGATANAAPLSQVNELGEARIEYGAGSKNSEVTLAVPTRTAADLSGLNEMQGTSGSARHIGMQNIESDEDDSDMEELELAPANEGKRTPCGCLLKGN
jgi:hypothetical protein